MPTRHPLLRAAGVGVRAMLVATLVLGVGYTGVVTIVGQLALPGPANGSLVRDGRGDVVGSALIGQSFTDAAGAALPGYFQSRPSAAGDGYDGRASSGSNLGPGSPTLVTEIAARRDEIAAREGVPVERIPADAVTASGSGLDPDISVAYAMLQAPRIAGARGMTLADVERMIAAHTAGRDLGFLGEPRVDVLALNLDLDEHSGR